MHFALFTVLLATSVHAQSCSTSLFPQDIHAVAAAIITADRTPILKDSPDGSDPIPTRAYLVKGNAVLATHTRGNYRCIAYFNGKKQTTGWIAQSALAPLAPPPSTNTWAGKWIRQSSDSGEAAITIRQKSGTLQAEAIATLALTEENVRTGAAGGPLQLLHDMTASFGDEGADRTMVCRVNVRLFGDTLLADDGAVDDSNSACAGMGVTFNGIYRRAGH